MPRIEIERLVEIMRAAARNEIMPRFRRPDLQGVRQKSEAIDLVTEADEAAERAIRAEVSALMPEALFVGEESVAADPALLARLADADVAVVVDPIDGTANFASGVPLFGVMMSVIMGGEVVAGIIYDPMGDDWLIAEKGAGAFMHRGKGGSERLALKAPLPLEQMVGMASVGFVPADRRPAVLANLAKVRLFASYRCAAHEYWSLATGHLSFAMYYKLMPWDHLAGSLLVTEAGGVVARLDGSAYLPSHTDGGLLAAVDKGSWEALSREVFVL